MSAYCQLFKIFMPEEIEGFAKKIKWIGMSTSISVLGKKSLHVKSGDYAVTIHGIEFFSSEPLTYRSIVQPCIPKVIAFQGREIFHEGAAC